MLKDLLLIQEHVKNLKLNIMPLQPFYYDGLTFASAGNVYTDSNLTTQAPDGFYSLGGIVRVKTGGVLGPPQNCPSCAVPCGTDGFAAEGERGVYTVDFELGSTPGAAIITFSPGISNVTCVPIPDKCTWSYNGVTASEYSSLLGGYQTGLIGTADGPPKGGTQCNACAATGVAVDPATGINPPLTIAGFAYNNGTGNFDPVGNITTPGITGVNNFAPDPEPGSTLLDWNFTNQGFLINGLGTNNCGNTTGIGIPVGFDGVSPAAPNLPTNNWPASGMEYRGATMVVPSPPGVTSTILSIEVVAPCENTWWGITVECPRSLTGIDSSTAEPQGTATATVCAKNITTTLFHVPVDAFGNSNSCSNYFQAGDEFPDAPASGQPNGVLGLHDWVFMDEFGQTPAPVGEYKCRFDAQDGLGVRNWHVSVGVREYRDTANNGNYPGCAPINEPATQPPTTGNAIKMLPPEGYGGSYNGVLGTSQTSGPYVPGIVRSIIPCP
tara:strand:- start:4665 stop:6152 length:1488 start_codon:yes stop_codon:yes gene_type:complete